MHGVRVCGAFTRKLTQQTKQSKTGNAGCWFDTATIVTNVRNFPHSRGFVVGILKSYLGLSASLYSTLYAATLAPDAVTLLLVLGLGPAAVSAVLAGLINYVPYVEACEAPGYGARSGGGGDDALVLTTERR
jgi:hypothetical protein